jgi:formate-dependent nitrite reductase membrane component NrfD
VPELAPPSGDYVQAAQTAGVGHFAERIDPKAAGASSTEGLVKLLGMAEQEAKVREAVDAPARRTYDAPQKGLLWDSEVTAYLWTKSIAAGALWLPLLLNVAGVLPLRLRVERGMAGLSLLFLALTGVLLVKDLDRPDRFLNVLLRPQWRSWLVRGAYIISAFGLCAFAWLLHLFFGQGPVVGLRAAMVVLGVLTAIYTAFLFAQAKGRDLWQSRLLPAHMLLQSMKTGAAVVLLIALLGGLGVENVLVIALAAALAAYLVTLAVEFRLPHSTHDTQAALRSIARGVLRVPFWSSVLLGNALPLALLLLWPAQGLAVFPASVLVLVFALVSEHVWVRAPQLVPLR